MNVTNKPNPDGSTNGFQSQLQVQQQNGWEQGSSRLRPTKPYPAPTARYQDIVRDANLFWGTLQAFHKILGTKYKYEFKYPLFNCSLSVCVLLLILVFFPLWGQLICLWGCQFVCFLVCFCFLPHMASYLFQLMVKNEIMKIACFVLSLEF